MRLGDLSKMAIVERDPSARIRAGFEATVMGQLLGN